MEGSEVEETPTVQIVPRILARSAVVAAVVGATTCAVLGRHALEAASLGVLVFFGFLGALAVVLYVLASGRFPPRIGRGDVDLPAKPVGTSLDALAKTVSEIADDNDELVSTVDQHDERLQRIEEQLRVSSEGGSSS